jgi:hypothetical protein
MGKGARIAYLFDYGDEWRLLLDITDDWPAGNERSPLKMSPGAGRSAGVSTM